MVRAAELFLLTDPETFSFRVFRPGDEIPEWALELVTHPDILEQSNVPEDEPEQAPEDDTEGADELEEDQTDEDDVSRETEISEEDSDAEEYAGLDELIGDDVEDDDQPRPTADWKKADILEYAMSNGIQITGSETKDQLLALINEG